MDIFLGTPCISLERKKDLLICFDNLIAEWHRFRKYVIKFLLKSNAQSLQDINVFIEHDFINPLSAKPLRKVSFSSV